MKRVLVEQKPDDVLAFTIAYCLAISNGAPCPVLVQDIPPEDTRSRSNSYVDTKSRSNSYVDTHTLTQTRNNSILKASDGNSPNLNPIKSIKSVIEMNDDV